MATSTKTELPWILLLPIELQHQIFSYILPHTFLLQLSPNPTPYESLIWRHNSISLLSTCRTLYEPALAYIYCTSIFSIHIEYDRIVFHHPYATPSGFIPKLSHPFPSCFASRNWRKIRNYVITIKQPDDYEGMVKYNCQGAGLTARMQAQVARLVGVLNQAHELEMLVVRHQAGGERGRGGD
jgi:hypothetical protein